MDKSMLVKEALAAMQNAYVPYSGFKVGAALLTESGRIYTGCNIENAAYSPCICAERTAAAKAVSEGERRFAAIAVVGGVDGDACAPCPPCGVCRQFLREFCDDGFPILLGLKDGSFSEYTLAQLLPLGFSDKNLTEI